MRALFTRYRASMRIIVMFCVAFGSRSVLPTASAQSAAKPGATSVKGVYLDEPVPPPEPTIVQEGPFTEKYDEGKGPVRVERHIRLMSDNQVVNHGKFTEYYRNGKKFAEGNYENGVHDGPWSYWHENGQLAKTVTFKKGAPDGEWEAFRADGTIHSKKGYRLGKREGTWVSYYDDGETSKIKQTFVDGKLSGPRITYYANGKPRQEANFADGALDGKMTEWDESGRKTAEAVFEKGKLNGTLVRWGADGSASEQQYRNNKLIPMGASNVDDALTPRSQEQPRLINSAK